MAIQSMDMMINAMGTNQRIAINKANLTAVAGNTLSLWSAVGNPTTGSTTLGQAATGAVPTSADSGAIPFTNPSAGLITYLGRVSGNSNAQGILIIYDILWVWGSGGSGWSVTTTGAQSTASPTALTRPDANGVGTELWVECLAAGGAASGTSTITYTNAAGTGSRSATLLSGAPISSPAIGTMQQYGLAAGDTGVKSIQSINNSNTWTSGTYRIMIIRRIAEIPTAVGVGVAQDALELGMPRIYDSACLGMAFNANSTATGPTIFGLELLQG